MPATPPVRIHRQHRRSMVMKLTPVGLVVFIPRRFRPDSPVVRHFIEQGLARLGHRVIPHVQHSTPDELRALVKAWAARIGVCPARVQLRDMYRKWGSCSSRGSITLNNALCHIPRPLAEYVILHELAHLTVFNHGPDFKALMSRWMPDWTERASQLDLLLTDRATA